MSLVPTPALQDCWNQVGVWGDSSCPRLAETVHCRNCPVYASASARLLHGEPPADYLREWTERLAQPRPAAESAKTVSVMIFRLGPEWFALSARVFQEVAEPRPVHSLPHRRGKVVRGVVNIRGELVVCVSLGGALRVEETAGVNGHGPTGTVYERLLVVATPAGRLAFAVSEVHGIEGFAPDQVLPVPETVALASARFTRGVLPWQGRRVGYVDDDLLFQNLNRSLG